MKPALLPSYGFVILLMCLISFSSFIYWLYLPCSVELSKKIQDKANLALYSGNNLKAASLFYQAGELHSNPKMQSTFFYMAANIEIDEKNYDIATRYVYLAIKTNPLNTDAQQQLARIIMEIKEIHKAANLLIKVDSTTLLNKGIINQIAKYKLLTFSSNKEKQRFLSLISTKE
jgi:hypothetical protein